MKLSLAVLLLALFTTSLAYRVKSKRDHEEKGDGINEKKILKDLDRQIVDGEEFAHDLAGKKHKKEGDAAVCVFEFFFDVSHSLDRIFGKEGGHDHEGGEGDELFKRLFRNKRYAESEEVVPTGFPSFRPTYHPSGGDEGKRGGALERLFKCLADNIGGDHEHGEGSGHEGSGHEGSGHEGSGHEGSGHEGSGHEGSGHEGSGHEGSGHEGSGHEGSGHEGSGHEHGGGPTGGPTREPTEGPTEEVPSYKRTMKRRQRHH